GRTEGGAADRMRPEWDGQSLPMREILRLRAPMPQRRMRIRRPAPEVWAARARATVRELPEPALSARASPAGTTETRHVMKMQATAIGLGIVSLTLGACGTTMTER